MNTLYWAQKASDWNRLKALDLDRVSSPITRRVYNLGLDEFFDWFRHGAAARLHHGDRQRLERDPGSPRGLGSSRPMRRTGKVKTMPHRAVANALRVRLQRCRFGIVRDSQGISEPNRIWCMLQTMGSSCG
jgi:hypothetical protein